MIAALCGRLVAIQENTVVLDVNGVGYEVTVTTSLLNVLGGVGDEAKFVVFTDVRETSISLFGFLDNLEKQVFLLLRKVKGIGSKLSLAIISNLGPERLLASIGQNDFTSLQKVPGVGRKTAERVIVELREQVNELISSGAELMALASKIEKANLPRRTSADSVPFANSAASDAVLALEKLGFNNERARNAVSLVLESKGNDAAINDPGEMLRLALANL